MYRRTPTTKCDFNEVALKFYWNRTSAWVFSCKFAAYFQNNLFLRTPLGDYFCRYDHIMLMADFSLTENKNLEVFMSAFDLECLIKVRKQCFSEKFRKKNLFWYSYFFWKDLFHGIFIFKFLLEVPKFMENILTA